MDLQSHMAGYYEAKRCKRKGNRKEFKQESISRAVFKIPIGLLASAVLDLLS